MNLDMPRDKQTGKTRGFAFLQYEDQRSTVLAVDNLNGAKVLGRVLRVDHTHKPKPKKDEEGNLPDEPSMNAAPPLLGESFSCIVMSSILSIDCLTDCYCRWWEF
jgi:RNA-binding motif X-linked protein 2